MADKVETIDKEEIISEDERPFWEGKEFSFNQNRRCEYFPCHKTDDPDNFNCMFCYCPLYALGDKCGGNVKYTENGIKDCSDCLVPHRRDSYGKVIERFKDICEMCRKNCEEK